MSSRAPSKIKSVGSAIPYRQIRAQYDKETITVYQAYSATIAEAAVRDQKLDASPDFLPHRMTWIKPSWCWMMYRSGYSLKDDRQARILALRMKHEHFRELLSHTVVCAGETLTAEEKKRDVRVQWDPERGPRLEVLPYRSIQIGIVGDVKHKWVNEWIVDIEDVTEMALKMKAAVEGVENVAVSELVEKGLMPVETIYEVDEEMSEILKMGQ